MTEPDGIHFYEPRKVHRLPHEPFNATAGPRPIGWIATRSTSVRHNLALQRRQCIQLHAPSWDLPASDARTPYRTSQKPPNSVGTS
jgi:hypothetical protein